MKPLHADTVSGRKYRKIATEAGLAVKRQHDNS